MKSVAEFRNKRATPRQIDEVVGITLGTASVRDLKDAWGKPINLGAVVAKVYEWTTQCAPTRLVSNIKLGPASWLANMAIYRGWPLTVVLFERQIDNVPVELRPLQDYLVHHAEEVVVCASTAERDDVILSKCDRLLDLKDFDLA